MIITKTYCDDGGVQSFDEVYEIRARAYGAYKVSHEFLNDINSIESMDLRRYLTIAADDQVKTTSLNKGTGRSIPQAWLYRAQEYMAHVNLRAQVETTQKQAAQTTNALVSRDPSIIKQEALAKQKLITKEFMNDGMKDLSSLVNTNFAKNSSDFKDNNLTALFNDVTELVDGGFSNPKLAKKVLTQMSEHKDTLRALQPNLASLAESAQERLKENSKSTDSVVTTKAAQLKIENDFFKKNQLQNIGELSEITRDERLLLLNHSSKPLNSSNPSLAISIVNEQREKQRNFISKVRDISNEIADSSFSSQKPRGLPVQMNHLNEKLIKSSDAAKNYKSIVNARLSSAKFNKGIDTAGVIDLNSRLILLDAMSGGSINPTEGFKVKSGLANLNISDILEKLPAGDLQAKKAFARYVLERGSPEQIRSLKIHAHSLVTQIKCGVK